MKLLLADDHVLVRESLSLVLEGAGNIEVSQAGDMDEASRLIQEDGPFDLVLLDYGMPGVGGLSGFKTVLSRFKGQTIALLSGVASKDIVLEALQLGAAGFVPKTLTPDSMVHAVRLMATGERYLPINFMTDAASDDQSGTLGVKLTSRESQVLRGLSEGLSNKEIAHLYDLQEVTVKLHVKTLCRKLQAKNRTHAAMIARDANLI